MDNAGYAALQIIPTFKGLEGNLEKGTGAILGRQGTKGGQIFGDSAGRSMSSRFVGHAKTAALLATGALAGVAGIAFKVGKDSLAEAREAQRVGAITRQVIKSTGGAANVSAGQVGKLSTAISNKVGIDDEAIESGANLLLTFKNVRNEAGKGNKIFDGATKVITDMAVAMDGGSGGQPDLKSSSILVGKALNDPIKGLTALSRVGVTFTEQQKDQIKSLVDSGNSMKAQKIILRELRSEFGGTAAAQATMGDKVNVAWKNIEENLGTTLLPLVDDLERAFLKKGVPALNKFSDWFSTDGIKGIHGFIADAKPLANSILPAAKNGLKDIAGFLKDAAPKAKAVIDAFNNLPGWAQKAVVLGGTAAIIGKKSGALSLGKDVLTGGSKGGSLLGLFSKSKPLPVFVVNQVPGVPGAPGVPKGGPGGSTLGTFGKLGFGLLGAGAIAAVSTGSQALLKKEYGDTVGSIFGQVQRSILGIPFMPPDAAKKQAEVWNAAFTGHFSEALDILKSPGPADFNVPHLSNPFGNPFNNGPKRPSGPPNFLQVLTNDSDVAQRHISAILQPLQHASAAIDVVSNRGTPAFGGLSDKIQGATNRTDALENKLRAFPKRIRTELDLDTRAAERNLATLRAHAGRHISAELSIDLIGHSPQQANLDGVRR